MRNKYHINEAVLASYVAIPNCFVAYIFWVFAVEFRVFGIRDTVTTIILAIAGTLPFVAVVGEFVGWKRYVLIILYVSSGLVWVAAYFNLNYYVT